MKIQAQNDFIIIRAEKPAKGIITIKTEMYNEKENWIKEAPLVVISAGPEVKNVKVGDRILVGSTASARYDYLTKIMKDENAENVTYFAVREKDVAMILEDN